MSEEFTVLHSDHLVTLLRGDDVAGHILPTHSGYVPFAFNQDSGFFEELSTTDSLKLAKRLIGDLFFVRARAA